MCSYDVAFKHSEDEVGIGCSDENTISHVSVIPTILFLKTISFHKGGSTHIILDHLCFSASSRTHNRGPLIYLCS